MALDCAHLVLNVSDVTKSKEFYIDKLNFELVEEHTRSFAFRAGSVRFTVTPGSGKPDSAQDESTMTVIFRTDNLEKTVEELLKKGIELSGEIQEAPGFMKFIGFSDPDNNSLMLAQYLRNPLERL